MNKKSTVLESFDAPVKIGKRWRVTVARPGQGASGFYSEQVLKETGPAAFPPGTKSFFNHDPKRDVRDMVGTFPEGAFWNEEEGELQADLEPFERFRPVLNEAGSAIEASIRSTAEKDPRGNVRALLPNRSNSIDLVAYAGLEGSGLKFQVESLFAAAASAVEEDEDSDAEASAQKNEEGINMEIEKEVAEIRSGLTALTAAFDAFVTESRAEMQGKADAEAVQTAAAELVAEALSAYEEKVAAIESANLLPKQAEALKARALKGEDIEEALTEAKTLVEEAEKHFKPEPVTYGRVRGNLVVTESAAPVAQKIVPGRWGK